MIRLILRLLRIRDFEVCQSCQTLKEQISFERSEKKELLDTLLRITNPKIVEAPVQFLEPVATSSAIFSKRRAALEEKSRNEAQIKRNSTVLGKPDDKLAELETELGVAEKEG